MGKEVLVGQRVKNCSTELIVVEFGDFLTLKEKLRFNIC